MISLLSTETGSDPGDLAELAKSWDVSLRALNRSPKTGEQYAGSVAELSKFLASHGMPTTVANIERKHIEHYLAELAERRSPATVQTRYKPTNRLPPSHS